MTASEKIKEIETLYAKPFKTYMDADRIQELREGLKVSDLFIYIGHDIGREWALKILGFKIMGDGRICEKIESAIEKGFIKSYSVKKYGRWVDYYGLSKQGKALLKL